MKTDMLEDSVQHAGIAVNITALGDYRFQYVNSRMCELTGYSEEELLQLTIPQITRAEDWKREADAMERLLSGRQNACAIDKRFVKKDGGTVPVSLKVSLVRDAAGTPIRRLSVVLRDYEEDWLGRREQFNAYSRAENLGGIARHQRLIGGLQTALELICSDSPLSVTLEHIARLMEAVSVDEVIASILLVDPLHRTLHIGAAPNLPPSYNAAIEGSKIGEHAGSCGTATYLKKPIVVSDIENDPRWQGYATAATTHNLRACWSLPLLDLNRDALGSCAMYYHTPREPNPQDYDTTALLAQTACLAIEKIRRDERLKNSEKQLQEFSARLESEVKQRTASLLDSLQFHERFLYAFEHELRAPLRSISGFCTILQEELSAAEATTTNASVENLLRRICASAQRMDKLIHSLLKFGRLTPKTIQRERIELDPLVRHWLEDSREQINRLNAICEVVGPLPAICGDENLTRALFQELLNNALKFHGQTSPPRIKLSGTRSDGQVTIAVEDFGIGIAPECHAKLFQPFHQFCEDGTFEGTGMGLAIAARVAHLMGGSVKLDHFSQPTRFIVELPCANEH